jgi:hypothetical protein
MTWHSANNRASAYKNIPCPLNSPGVMQHKPTFEMALQATGSSFELNKKTLET